MILPTLAKDASLVRTARFFDLVLDAPIYGNIVALDTSLLDAAASDNDQALSVSFRFFFLPNDIYP